MSVPSLASQLILDLPRDDVLHVLAVFQEEAARLSLLLTKTAQDADSTAFRRAAHAIAGAAGAVGAVALERGARAAMAPEGLTPARMLAACGEIATLAAAARDEAAAVVARLASAPG